MKPKLMIHGKEVQSRKPGSALSEFAGRGATEALAKAETRLLAEGIGAFFMGDMAKAAESLLGVLNINYANPEACLYMGRLCRRQRASNAAISYLARAIDAGAMDPELHIERGIAVLEKRSGLWSDANKALNDFATAFLLDSNQARALYYMAVCKHRMRDYDEALALFEKYVEMAPVDLQAARELDVYRHKTRYFMHYSDMSLIYGSWKYC